MKKLSFIILFISVNILIVFLHIHKQSQIIKLSYTNQKMKRELDQLEQKKEAFTHQLQALKNPSAIKEYAEQELDMKKIKLSQIKKVPQ